MIFTLVFRAPKLSYSSFLDRIEMALINERFNDFDGKRKRGRRWFPQGKRPFEFIQARKKYHSGATSQITLRPTSFAFHFPPLHLIKANMAAGDHHDFGIQSVSHHIVLSHVSFLPSLISIGEIVGRAGTYTDPHSAPSRCPNFRCPQIRSPYHPADVGRWDMYLGNKVDPSIFGLRVHWAAFLQFRKIQQRLGLP